MIDDRMPATMVDKSKIGRGKRLHLGGTLAAPYSTCTAG